MKLVLALSFTASLVNAGWNDMFDSLGALAGNLTSGPGLRSGSNSRSITTILGQASHLINDYGCWCYFNENHGKGKGRPVNSVDEICYQLAHGYNCAMMDEPGCVPWEVPYISGISGGLPGLVGMCDTVNDPTTEYCANAACKVEGHFVLTIFGEYLLTGDPIDQQFKHDNGFEPEVECPTREGNGGADYNCCGEHPNRFQFRSLAAAPRECCVDKVYATSMYECCPDGEIRLSC